MEGNFIFFPSASFLLSSTHLLILPFLSFMNFHTSFFHNSFPCLKHTLPYSLFPLRSIPPLILWWGFHPLLHLLHFSVNGLLFFPQVVYSRLLSLFFLPLSLSLFLDLWPIFTCISPLPSETPKWSIISSLHLFFIQTHFQSLKDSPSLLMG